MLVLEQHRGVQTGCNYSRGRETRKSQCSLGTKRVRNPKGNPKAKIVSDRPSAFGRESNKSTPLRRVMFRRAEQAMVQSVDLSSRLLLGSQQCRARPPPRRELDEGRSCAQLSALKALLTSCVLFRYGDGRNSRSWTCSVSVLWTCVGSPIDTLCHTFF